MVYMKKIITINPPWNLFQKQASGNTNTLSSHGTNSTKICSSLPPSHSIWAGVARRLNISRDTAQEMVDFF